MKQRGVYLWLFAFVVFLSACGSKEKIDPVGSWSVDSGATVSWMAQQNALGNQNISISWEILSWGVQTWIQLSWTRFLQIKGPFPVELCNRIIAFDQCIIAKAPIENQQVMKQQLIKVIEPWRLLADAQLREICQQITVQESFLEVVKHYEKQGCKF